MTDYLWTGAPHLAQKAALSVRADPQLTQNGVGGGAGEVEATSGGLGGGDAGGMDGYWKYG